MSENATTDRLRYGGSRKLMAYAIVTGQTYTDGTGRVWTPEEAAAATDLGITEADMAWARERRDHHLKRAALDVR